MTVKQISVFLENKPGQLSNVTKALAENNIDMRALSLASPMAMLVFSEAYASDLGAVKNEA